MKSKVQHSTGTYIFDRDVMSVAEMSECTDGKTCHASVIMPTGEQKNLGWVSHAGIDTAIAKLLASGGKIVD
jgi:hypothetical protein